MLYCDDRFSQPGPLGQNVRPDELNKWVSNALRSLESLSSPGFGEEEVDKARLEDLKLRLRMFSGSSRTFVPEAYRLGN